MSKITLLNVGSIQDNPTSATTTLNTNSNTLQTAFDNTLSRDGTSPNQMGNNFDMNGFRILNLPAPIGLTDPVRLEDIGTLGGNSFTSNPVFNSITFPVSTFPVAGIKSFRISTAGDWMDIGYNIDAFNWTLVDPTDRGLFFGQEGDFNDGSGQDKMEQYWQFQKVSGFGPDGGGNATYCRTVMAQYNKVTGLPTALNLSSGTANGILFGINDGTGSAIVEQVIGKLKMQMQSSILNVYNTPGAATLAFSVNSTASSAATGFQIATQAAGSGVKLSVTSTNSSDNLFIDSLGTTGNVFLGNSSGGPVIVGRAIAVGAEATNRGAITILCGQTDAATNGVEFKASTGGAGFGFREATVFDGGSNMDFKVQSRQNSATWTDILLFKGSTGNANFQKGIFSANPTNGIGYTVGSGSSVAQATSRTTAVTLNNVTGAITLVSAAGSATFQSFTFTNSTIAATDVVEIVQKSGTDKYQIFVTAVAAGSCQITYATTGGTTTETPVFNYVVLKGSIT